MANSVGIELRELDSVNPQLSVIAEDYLAALDRLRSLEKKIPNDRWAVRPDPHRWSVSECVAHLNITSRLFIPELERAIDEARLLPVAPAKRYRKDPVGWLLWKIMPPPVKLRAKAPSRFNPEMPSDKGESIKEFELLQEAQVGLLRQANGLPIDQVRVPSPFSRKVSYNLFAAFSILPLHQHRHLWQAEQVWRRSQGPS